MKKVANVILLGESRVGKTNLRNVFTGQGFNPNTMETLGIDCTEKNCQPTQEPTTPPINVKFWDTAGQERFKSITRQFYRQCDAALVIFDLTSKASFASVRSFILQIEQNCPQDMAVVLVGNKRDLGDERQVFFEEAS